MSSQSPQELAATKAQQANFDYQGTLSGISLPGIKATLESLQRQLGSGGLNQDVHAAFDSARSELGQGYENATMSAGNLTRQQALQSGEVYQPSQINDAITLQATQLDQQRVQGMRNLQFQEAQAGLTQYNQLMNLLGQGSGAALNLGQGYSGVQASAIGGMNNQSVLGGTLGGDATGAAAGSAFGAYGAIAGGLIGAGAGYYGSRP